MPGTYFANGDHCQEISVDAGVELVFVCHGTSCGEVDWIDRMGDLADWLEPQLPDAP